jgi:hypothetical protein
MPTLLGLLEKPISITVTWLGENNDLGKTVCHSNKENLPILHNKLNPFTLRERYEVG